MTKAVEERWKDVVGYEGLYQISDMGSVKSLIQRYGDKNIILKPIVGGSGYPLVTLCKNKQRTNWSIHTLVLTAFVGQNPKNMECRHLDGNRKNPILTNLKWGTRCENQLDAKKHGTYTHGSIHGCSKLTERDVLRIRVLLKRKIKPQKIAEEFGVHQSTVSAIKTKRLWRHVDE